jgi:hypothetical protein
MGPFDWGIRFEPVVKQVLESRWGTKIQESGRLLHPTEPHIAASPDGLILEAADEARVGRLLEIKCPISRTVGQGVPFDYWCQMQVQMEVCGIDECDYVEVKLQSFQGADTEWPAGAQPDGHVWLLEKVEAGAVSMTYAYTVEERDTLLSTSWDLVETIPWRVDTLYHVLVTRDRNWYRSTAELQAKFWADVAKARAGQFEAAPSSVAGRGALKVVVTKEPSASVACLFLDDSPRPEEGLSAAEGEAPPTPAEGGVVA